MKSAGRGAMCGRYTLGNSQDLYERFRIKPNELDIDPRYNVAPSQFMPVIVREECNRLTLMEWGLLPFWAKDPKSTNRLINARVEGILTKPSFRKAVREHRCLVPADGFYEWMKGPQGKIPVYIRRSDAGLFAFAGIYDEWRGPAGEVVESYAILTTTPNSLLAKVHNRMPVILEESMEADWLDASADIASLLKTLAKPFPPEPLEMYRVSPRVNAPKLDSPSLIERA
jgi:putative SOS response-associated peptidase YedK